MENNTSTQSKRLVTVTADDLPLHCPMLQSALWSSHPRVYIPLKVGETEPVICPYCGAQYVIK